MAYTTIKKPSDYFNTKLYTGNGSSQSFTGVGFQPDFTWIKRRGSAEGHSLFDAVRGVQKRLVTNDNGSEATIATSLTAFGSDGFTLGGNDTVNGSDNYASWNWLANGTGSANTDGTISSTVSANTTSGFSIVSYTGNGSDGATVGHGLGVNPSAILFKRRDSTSNWSLMGQNIGTAFSSYLKLETTDAFNTNSGMLQNSNSSTFTIGTNSRVNTSSASMIAYCFAEKTGYSKIGSYVGNGNANGTFIYTGFKPAFVMVKRSSAVQGWVMWDNKRPGYNLTNQSVTANESSAEETGRTFDILSNGFKIRDTNTASNASGSSYIYMAFAEEPLVGDNPATAR